MSAMGDMKSRVAGELRASEVSGKEAAAPPSLCYAELKIREVRKLGQGL